MVAMDEQSIVLFYDFVLEDRLAQKRACFADWTMMLQNAAMERSWTQWKNLIESAGLEFVKVWKPQGGGEALVEARLKRPRLNEGGREKCNE